MRSPDPIAPERLDDLLRGRLPESEREARLQGLVRELRSDAPPAPEALRAHARALREPAPRSRPRFTWRRAALVLAPAGVAALVIAFVFGGDAGPRSERGSVEGEAFSLEEAAPTPAPAPKRTASSTLEGASGEFRALGADTLQSRLALIPSGPRARDVEMLIELRLRDADRLSEAANDATRITRELGGHVASSGVMTRGQEGRAELELRVPVGRVEDAVFRLSQLGTITSQQVAVQDLQGGIDRRSRQIEALRRAIRIAELKLGSGTLDAEERLALEIRLEQWRAQLAQLVREKQRLLREAATAELTLTLHTREAPAERKEESGAAGSARDALDFLAGAGAVALYAAIVLSPLILLAVLLWLILRGRSRRVEERLLEHPRPAAPSPQAPPR